MDKSLILVLSVVGVVAILLGVASYMKSRRAQKWERVDSDILFEKEGDAPPREKVAEELEGLSSIVKEEGEPAAVAPAAPAPAGAERSRPATRERERSAFKRGFLERIVGDRGAEPEEEAAPGPYRDGAPEWVVVLNVMAREGEVFTGPGFFLALEENGWRFGEMEIFHYRDNGVPLFSLVNMVKPGTFDPARPEAFRSPGVSLFIRFPNDYGHGLRTFDMMYDMAQLLADRLGGELRDENRSVLTQSAIDHLREKITTYDLKWLRNPR